jgi:hypothetical protein
MDEEKRKKERKERGWREFCADGGRFGVRRKDLPGHVVWGWLVNIYNY